MSNWLQAMVLVFDPTLFSQCEFDAVKLIWMTRTNREAPCQVELHLRAARCRWINLANRALEQCPRQN